MVSGVYRSTCTQTYACAYNLTQQVQVLGAINPVLIGHPKLVKNSKKNNKKKKDDLHDKWYLHGAFCNTYDLH